MAGIRAWSGLLEIRRDRLRQLPRAVTIKVIGQALAEVGGRPAIELAAVERLTDRLIREPLKVTLHGCIVRSNGVDIRIEREPLTGARARRVAEP